MTTAVVTVNSDAPFQEMVAKLGGAWISALPVVDEAGRVVGVVCESDLMARDGEAGGAPGLPARWQHHQGPGQADGVIAAQLMSSPPVTICPCASVRRAALVMRDRRVRQLPVVDDTGGLIGIVTRRDVLSALSRPDEEIRREVTDRLIPRTFRLDPGRFAVTVQDGIVILAGRPASQQTGRDLIEAVRHLEGVVAVRDQLAYPAGGRPAPSS